MVTATEIGNEIDYVEERDLMTRCVQQKPKMHHFFLIEKVQLFCTGMFCKLGSVDRLHSEIM
jgi:hypothetical protein